MALIAPTPASRRLQARIVFRTQEIMIPCRCQDTAARVYDALSLNSRGPAAVATLNSPQHVPDAVFAKLAVSRYDVEDAIGRYCDANAHLVPALLAAAGVTSDKVGSLYGRSGGGGSGSGLYSSDGIAYSSSSSQEVSEDTAPALVLSEGKMALLHLGLEVARERLRTQPRESSSFLGVEKKVRWLQPVSGLLSLSMHLISIQPLCSRAVSEEPRY